MLKPFVTAAAAVGLLVSSSIVSVGAPVGMAPLSDLNQSASPIEKTRLFCYNRYTGRFLHWGSCGGGYRRHYSRPRVYCRTRYGHRFLHWGAC
ncbi:MAG: hypothetical protein INR70_26595 [Parafilimonas terrae]|nr:hypothetical protein [Parafilimonas terrae]